MLKKFLAFFGLTEVTLTDGTAKVELTEAQMTASGQIIADLETAQAELKSEKEINVTAQSAIAIANSRITELEAENAQLRKTPGASTTVAPKTTDGNQNPDPYKIDMPESLSLPEQLAAFNKAFKGE